MDGIGRCMDNVFVERLWRSLKYEEVFIKAHATATEAHNGIGAYLTHYNDTRPHQALGYGTPREVFAASAGLWICGRSAPPTDCAFPKVPTNSVPKERSEQGTMGTPKVRRSQLLAFAHLPTGPTASTKVIL